MKRLFQSGAVPSCSIVRSLWRRQMQRILPALCLALICSTAFAEENSTTWQGRWNNRKYNTSGPLKCVATETEKGEWKATFSGTFKGDPFSYDATFQSKQSRNQFDLSGKATIRGHQYEWVGVMKGQRLSGRYRSSVGYFGEFVLQQSE